jgi:hypothetical protein
MGYVILYLVNPYVSLYIQLLTLNKDQKFITDHIPQHEMGLFIIDIAYRWIILRITHC